MDVTTSITRGCRDSSRGASSKISLASMALATLTQEDQSLEVHFSVLESFLAMKTDTPTEMNQPLCDNQPLNKLNVCISARAKSGILCGVLGLDIPKALRAVTPRRGLLSGAFDARCLAGVPEIEGVPARKSGL